MHSKYLQSKARLDAACVRAGRNTSSCEAPQAAPKPTSHRTELVLSPKKPKQPSISLHAADVGASGAFPLNMSAQFANAFPPPGCVVISESVVLRAMEMQMATLALLRDSHVKLMSNYDDLKSELHLMRESANTDKCMLASVHKDKDAVAQQALQLASASAGLHHELASKEQECHFLKTETEGATKAMQDARAACANEVLKWKQAVLELKQQMQQLMAREEQAEEQDAPSPAAPVPLGTNSIEV
jgi:predicted  nucleic acid-binding Zn-ribbon protein